MRGELTLHDALVPLPQLTIFSFFALMGVANVAPRKALVSCLGAAIMRLALMFPSAFAVASLYSFRARSALVPEFVAIFAKFGFSTLLPISNKTPRFLGIVSPLTVLHLFAFVDPLRLTMAIVKRYFSK